MSDITELSIAELAQRFRDKSLSPVEATHAYLARISKFNDRVNAFVLLREEDALAEAREAEAEIAAKTAESEKAISEIRAGALESATEVAKDTTKEILAAMGFSADAKTVDAAVSERIKG